MADIESALGLITNEVLTWTLHTLHGINKINTLQESVHLCVFFFSKQNVFVNSQDLIYFYCNLIIVRKKSLVKISALNKNTVNFPLQCLITHPC